MSNPFDDDGDDGMLYNKNNRDFKKQTPSTPPEEEFNFYEKQIEEILQRTLESSNKSVVYLEESEQIGSATANDLLVQGEKLRKVDKQLDEIHDTTKQTQKHLNNIKSVFGGFKNYFAKKPSLPNKQTDKGSQDGNKLETTVTKLNSSSAYEDTQISNMNKGGGVSHSLSDSSRAALQGTRWGAMDDEIDNNLDQMSANLRRLRDLGSALGGEIDDQNKLLDKIAVKADKTDVEIRHQDKQMKRLLGPDKSKKPASNESNTMDDIKGKVGKM